jgi:hypothetical protein
MELMMLCLGVLSLGLLATSAAPAQVIEYEKDGVKHQTLTRSGVTVMFAVGKAHVKEYTMIQVSVANGSDLYSNISPEDFNYERADHQTIRAANADDVVKQLLERASLADVQKLVLAYENQLYGIPNMRSQNGYEQRRRNAMSEGVPAKFKAAAAASALAFVPTRLSPGQSTDGAIFFPIEPKLLNGGRLVVRTSKDTYEFNPIQ